MRDKSVHEQHVVMWSVALSLVAKRVAVLPLTCYI